MFYFIKNYYEMGLYNKDDLATLKDGGMLTQDEYNSLINPAPKS